jgi:type IV secretion system protein VirB10
MRDEVHSDPSRMEHGPTRDRPDGEEIDSAQEPMDGLVRGERAAPSVSRALPLRSRASSVLAGGLTMVLGLAALTWYYTNALTRPDRAREAAQAASARRAQGDIPLPPLGRIDPPLPVPGAGSGAAARAIAAPAAAAEQSGHSSGASVPISGTAPTAAIVPVTGTNGMFATETTSNGGAAFAKVTSADGLTRASLRRTGHAVPVGPRTEPGTAPPDQRLTGPVFVRQSSEPSPNARPPGEVSDWSPSGGASQPSADEHGLASLLRPTSLAAVQAKILPTRRFLLPKGSFIDCTLETAIDSSVPGITTCIVATDTFSADGNVVLLERGTRLVGETRGQVQQGTARLFVLWTEARTPTGVVVPLDSPGTDELGRSGLAGTVDRHFWERFGSAILISAIDGAVQAATQRSTGSGGTVIYNPSGSQEVLTEVLKGTINIAPTVKKTQGDRIQVLVARDVDFRSVYELQH